METDAGWPPVEYESREWRSGAPNIPQSRRQLLRARGPYAAAVPALIAEQGLRVGAELAADAADATAELVRFDAEVGGIAAPFAAILLRSESASSSEIEQLTSGARAIALAELNSGDAPNARLIVSNVRAMERALVLADRLDEDAVIEMQRVLLQDSDPAHVGAFRAEAVWIGGGATSPHGAEFVPPHHDRVPELVRDLLRFARRVDLPVFCQIAVAHAQFETIHPFTDGNGRTGRALVQSMLRHHGITRTVTVPVSAGLLQHTGRYFDALGAYRAGDLEPIVGEFTAAAFAAVANGRTLVDELEQVRRRWDGAVTARAGSGAVRLLDVLRRQPVLDVALVVRELGTAAPNALAAIERLVDDGVLTQIGSARRNRIWQAPEVLDALDAFVARAKRRRG